MRIMKTIFRNIAIMLLIGSTLSACKKELKEIGTPASKLEAIQANWELLKAVQVDEVSLIRESANITSYFYNGVRRPNISFTATTYTIDTVGLSYNFFGSTSGTWAFDNVEFPSVIKFTPNDAAPFDFKLNGPIRPQDNLKFTRPVYTSCKGATKMVMSYNLEFERK